MSFLIGILVPAIILVLLFINQKTGNLRFKRPGKHGKLKGTRVIALDAIKKLLLVVDHNQDSAKVVTISLQKLATTILTHHKDEEGLVDRISLDLVDRYGRMLCRLSFFHHDVDAHINLPSAARRAFYWKCRLDQYREMTVDPVHAVHWMKEDFAN